MRPSPVDPATFRHGRNLALARLSELLAPLLRVTGRVAVRDRPTPPASWRRGILIGADHIGDVLYNTASLAVLSEAFPECDWHYVARSPAAEILANNPSIQGCVSSLDSLGPVDVALCYNSGGYWRDLIEVTRAGIPNRIAYAHKGFSALVTHPISIRYLQPFPAYFRDLVAQLAGRAGDWSLRPRVFPSASDDALADEFCRELKLDPARQMLACFITSRQSSGVLPANHYGAAIEAIERQSSAQTILFGAPVDRPLLEEVKKRFHLRAQIAAGRLGLLSLVSFLGKCAAVFCTDSGPRHLANAAGVPPIYFRNISFSKIEAGPYCDREIDLAPDVEFVRLDQEEKIFAETNPARLANGVLSVLARGGS